MTYKCNQRVGAKLNKTQFCLLKMLIGKLGCVPKTGHETGKKLHP